LPDPTFPLSAVRLLSRSGKGKTTRHTGVTPNALPRSHTPALILLLLAVSLSLSKTMISLTYQESADCFKYLPLLWTQVTFSHPEKKKKKMAERGKEYDLGRKFSI